MIDLYKKVVLDNTNLVEYLDEIYIPKNKRTVRTINEIGSIDYQDVITLTPLVNCDLDEDLLKDAIRYMKEQGLSVDGVGDTLDFDYIKYEYGNDFPIISEESSLPFVDPLIDDLYRDILKRILSFLKYDENELLSIETIIDNSDYTLFEDLFSLLKDEQQMLLFDYMNSSLFGVEKIKSLALKYNLSEDAIRSRIKTIFRTIKWKFNLEYENYEYYGGFPYLGINDELSITDNSHNDLIEMMFSALNDEQKELLYDYLHLPCETKGKYQILASKYDLPVTTIIGRINAIFKRIRWHFHSCEFHKGNNVAIISKSR